MIISLITNLRFAQLYQTPSNGFNSLLAGQKRYLRIICQRNSKRVDHLWPSPWSHELLNDAGSTRSGSFYGRSPYSLPRRRQYNLGSARTVVYAPLSLLLAQFSESYYSTWIRRVSTDDTKCRLYSPLNRSRSLPGFNLIFSDKETDESLYHS